MPYLMKKIGLGMHALGQTDETLGACAHSRRPKRTERTRWLFLSKLIKDEHFVIPAVPQVDFAELCGLVHPATS